MSQILKHLHPIQDKLQYNAVEILSLPDDCAVHHDGPVVPCVFVADEVFPLRRHLMRPFPGKDLSKCQLPFNYRLSRARRIIENTWSFVSEISLLTWRTYCFA